MSWKVRRQVTFLLILVVLLVGGCDRPATRTSWSPINQVQETAAVSTPLPNMLAGTAPAASTTETVPTAEETTDLTALPTQLPHSIKGYELYSWKVGEVWNFTLITGTDRTKAFDEITAPGNTIRSNGFVKITTAGIDNLEKVLGLLPAGETIIWGGMDLGTQVDPNMVYLTYPPQPLMDEVSAFCASHQLSLTTLQN